MRYEALPALLSAIAACAKSLGDDAVFDRDSEINMRLSMSGLFDGLTGFGGSPFK